MENEKISILNFELRAYSVNTLVIGSGAAALNAAVSLHRNGVTSFILATTHFGGGTSNNAGSDKQTYYKLSLSGNEPDSVIDMATDLFNGRCMHGDIALCEAQGSVQAFMRLAELGVPFPHDKYGSYAGYKTDHDPRSRATSAGPYTSRMMFNALSSELIRCGIKILDRHYFVALLKDKEAGRVTGALAIDLEQPDPKKSFVLFNCENIILGTGGPAGIYETSVYPESQTGSTGIAFMAGAVGQNLTESQFGIASLKFRWNLSGSYQQVIPRYVSTDAYGNDEREFLNDHFPDMKTLTRAIFLKGYQWPFDPRKIADCGSSLIDILVDSEINTKKRKVYLDFTRNPSALNREEFTLEGIDPVAWSYLNKSCALKGTPYERLKALNRPAIELYLDHNIDLSSEYLQIAVCAQHNNGGLKGNIWWESNLKHLFPVGEVNGSHGVYRPGGSALNSGQVGSYRAAEYISRKYNSGPCELSSFLEASSGKVEEYLFKAERFLSASREYTAGNLNIIRQRMSSAAGITRSNEKASRAAEEARELLENLEEKLGAKNTGELAGCFLQLEHCLTHYIYLKAVEFYTANGGKSRGSYSVTSEKNADIFNPELCDYTSEIEKSIIEVSYKDLEVSTNLVTPVNLPEQDLWFEKVWREYLEDI